ncbi:MAG TPA: hypothetical protein VFK86_18205 [Bauldia sp.]|nr:hypothetical protein [Bauldia sp.]
MRIAILTPPRTRAVPADIEEVQEIDAALHRLGHETVAATWFGANDRTRKALDKANADIVFNLVHKGEDPAHIVTAFLDAIRVPYTGAHTQALEALADEPRMKATLAEGDLPVAEAPAEGRVFRVAVLETVLGPQVLPASPDPANGALLADLQRLALAAWRIFALTGYARVDFRVDPDDHPFILAVNANPSLSADAGFCAAAAEAGMSQSDVVSHLLAAAQN